MTETHCLWKGQIWARTRQHGEKEPQAMLNQSKPGRRTIRAMTGQQYRGQWGGGPLWRSQGWKSLSLGFSGSQNSSTDQNLWTIKKWKTFVIQIGPLGAIPPGLHLEKLVRGNKHSHKPKRKREPFWPQFYISHFYISKSWDVACFTLTLGQKQLLFGKWIIHSFDQRAKWITMAGKTLTWFGVFHAKELHH